MQKLFFHKKLALITGASSGIGKATAELFAKLGASLFLTGRNSANLEITANECHKLSISEDQKIFQFNGDLRRQDDINAIVREVIKLKQLDILINNAGILISDSIENVDLAKFDDIMHINLRSVVQLTNMLVPALIQSQGCVVNVSSVTGLRAFPNVLSYCVSKAAIEQFTKCAALELAPKGVRVNAVR